MARMTDEELKALFKSGVTELHRMDKQDPTAWAEELRKIEEMEIQNPLLRDREVVIQQITDFYLEKLGNYRKPIRYSRDRYEELITKFVLLFEKPILASFAACDIMDSCSDPTEKLEDCIRFAEVNLGARFERVSDAEASERTFQRAKRIAASQGYPVPDESRARVQFQQMQRLAQTIKDSGVKGDKLIEQVWKDFVGKLRERGLKTRDDGWYRDAIQFIMQITEEPEQTAVALTLLSMTEDPTTQLEQMRAYATRCIES
jgi:hypothetical protein